MSAAKPARTASPCRPIDLRPDLRLIFVTGHAGAGKSTLARDLYCGLPEDWRLVSLDDAFGLVNALRGEDAFWAAARRHLWIPASTLRYYASRRARMIVEGVLLHDEDVDLLTRAAGFEPGDRAIRLLWLFSSQDEMVTRKARMPFEEEGRPDYAELHTHQARIMNLHGALRLETTGLTPRQVRRRAVRLLNGPPPGIPAITSAHPPNATLPRAARRRRAHQRNPGV